VLLASSILGYPRAGGVDFFADLAFAAQQSGCASHVTDAGIAIVGSARGFKIP